MPRPGGTDAAIDSDPEEVIVKNIISSIVRFVTRGERERRERTAYVEGRIKAIREECRQWDDFAEFNKRPVVEFPRVPTAVVEEPTFIRFPRRGSFMQHECEFPEVHNGHAAEVI